MSLFIKLQSSVAWTLQNVDGCVYWTPKVVHFGEFDMDADTFLESSSNIDWKQVREVDLSHFHIVGSL